jgi:phenylalanyl-tRNA synthetase beta chain
MTISYQWLLEYLPEAVSVEELSTILTSIGLEVEAVEPMEAIKGSLNGLVIGEVLTCEKHPNADKLSKTTVNIGGAEPLKIVCGAPNVAAGQKVVVATVGTTIYPTDGEPMTMKKAKIRGEESEGMICAEDEIGLGNSHAGIIILPETAIPGTPAQEYFKIPKPDYVIHIGLTPNRSDAMSHIGVARDVCAYLTHHTGTHHSVQIPAFELPSKSEATRNIPVHVIAEDACPLYMGLSISGIRVGSSPEWMQQRLKTIGVRAINNVVDITNYVLHEYGQPLHAFDADKIAGQQIQVRFEPSGTKFTALDDKEITLQDHDLMICDAQGGMCIAGVYGGKHSGVGDATTSIFLESAYFKPKFVRRTSMHHGLRTDAATHFEKGVDIQNVLPALQRAAALIADICGGTITSDVISVQSGTIAPVYVSVSYAYIHKLSGKQYAEKDIQTILIALGFEITEHTDAGLVVKVPTNKTDVTQPADIVEEILRIDGLDNIEIPNRLNISLMKAMPHDRDLKDKAATLLTNAGFQEIVTNSIVNSKYYPERTDLVKMLNSLSAELDVMRPMMLESGLDVVAYNCNRKNTDLLLYEFGKVYSIVNGKYTEQEQLAMWVTGNVQGEQWNSDAETSDIYYLKGIMMNLLAKNNIEGVQISYEQNESGQVVIWKWKNQNLCTMMSVAAQKLQDFGIKQTVYYAQIDWAVWVKACRAGSIKYEEIPKFPAVKRDLAIVLAKNVGYEQVQKITQQQKIQPLQSFDLFDIFESEKLGVGKKSFAMSYTFQLTDRTLTDVEIDEMMQQLMKAYQTKLEAQIRE